MLQRLFVQNILFIEQIDIDLNNGLSVITGETGSGKSVLLECIKLAMGEKIPLNFGAKNNLDSHICLEFDIHNNKFVKNFLYEHSIRADNDILSIRRSFNNDKKSKVFLNNIPVNLSLLKEISLYLLEYQGQHSQTILLDVKKHQEILDKYGSFNNELLEISQLYHKIKNQIEEIETLENGCLAQKEDLQYIDHAIKELETLNLQENEFEELSIKRHNLTNDQKNIDLINNALSLLENSKIESILISSYRSLDKLQTLSNNTIDTNHQLQILDRMSIDLSEILDSLHKILQEIEGSDNLETLEERFFLLKDLSRKYRCTPDKLKQFMMSLKEKKIYIENIDTNIAAKREKLNLIQNEYLSKSISLSSKRRNLAKNLEKLLSEELKSLKMDQVIFKIDIISDEKILSPSGIDKIEFLVSTNPDIPVAPLKEVSSGGELSRFILAIRVVLSSLKSPPTIIYDEIDTGLGGSVADSVGEKLLKLSKDYQIIVITHHPQVAAKANHHYLIQKQYLNHETTMMIKILDYEGKQEEIARMISGKSITNQARDAAKTLLQYV